MSITITQLELENVKRIKAVSLTPEATGLTIIGGRNNQGKTSVLDAIAYALGGNKHRPSNPKREGAPDDPHLRVVLSNGIIVERKGKNGSLKVTDPSGRKAGQALLDSLLSELALDLPRFLEANDREKADTLLQIIGVKDQLAQMDALESSLYSQRWAVGQQADKKRKYADELPGHPEAPMEPVSAADLIRQQQDILARNADNQRKRARAAQYEAQVSQLQERIALMQDELAEAQRNLEIARTSAQGLEDQSTAELERQLNSVEQINQMVRDNQAKAQAQADAQALAAQYSDLTGQIEDVRSRRRGLLDKADLPLPGLSVEQGKLCYNGQQWDCMSGSDQLRVAVAIVRRLNPECGFVLLDKLEQMDTDTLREFGVWLESEGLQAIATRVSTGDECSIIIEDGMVQAQAKPTPVTAPAPTMRWTPGKF
ncbi:MAG: AAA family ATPase [Clostridiales bacterium]|nr:AAA family ATPase [Clostridiales bacterium]